MTELAHGVHDTPFTINLLRSRFPADDQYRLSGTVPPGLSGHQFGFSTFKLDGFGRAAQSNIERVDFQ